MTWQNSKKTEDDQRKFIFYGINHVIEKQLNPKSKYLNKKKAKLYTKNISHT
jgi:hypothetical protein